MTSLLYLVVFALPVMGGNAIDTTVTKGEILRADSALHREVETRGAVAFLDAFEPDGALLFTTAPIMRADSGRTLFLARYAKAHYTWQTLHVVAGIDGRFGCTIGVSRFTTPADTTPIVHRGAFETCWRKSADGRWRI